MKIIMVALHFAPKAELLFQKTINDIVMSAITVIVKNKTQVGIFI